MISEKLKKFYNPLILKEACSKYGIMLETAMLIRGNANLIYDCGDKILRLTHSGERRKEDIALELDWLFFLKEKDLPVVEILPSIKKELIVQIGNNENYFSCVCFAKIQGEIISEEDWNTSHFEKLGRITGLLHREGQKYVEKPETSFKHWNEAVEIKYLPKDERDLSEVHNLLVNEFLTYPKSKENYGLIHYDIHQGNYLLKGSEKKLILFDFEMTCKSWYINDVSAVLYYASYYRKSESIKNFESYFLNSFWQGYEKEYYIDGLERVSIPKFLLYRDLMVYSFLHEIYPNKERPENTESYMDRLSILIERRRERLKM